MVERRQVDRRTTTEGALVFTKEDRGVLSIALRDISDAGIGLRINEHYTVPSAFLITMDNFRNVHACKVIWSRGRYIGATFGATTTIEKSDVQFARI